MPQVQVPKRAVDGLLIYIMGCQLELISQHLFKSGRPRSRTLILDPAEPRNIGHYGWPMAVSALRQRGLWSRQDLLTCAKLATAQAWEMAAYEGMALPLAVPAKFRSFTAAEWADLAAYFVPR